MTESEAKINDALAKASGNIGYAAIILGTTTRKLKGQIEASPVLSRVIAGMPPKESEALKPVESGEHGGNGGAGEDKAVVSVVEANDNALALALKAAGFDDGDVSHASALQNIAIGSMRGTFQLMHGGLTATFMGCISERNKVLEIVRDIVAKLKDTATYPYGSKDRWRIMTEAHQWMLRLREIDDSIIRTNEVLHRGALALAERRTNSEMTKRKPGFSPRATRVVDEPSQ